MFYTVLVLLTAAVSAVTGFRRGMARMTPAVIGTAFGIISARLLAPGLAGVLYGAFPMVHGRPEEHFVYDTIGCAIVFFGVYFIFAAVTGFLGNVFKRDDRTILDNLGGSLFAILRNMLFLSIALNLLVALDAHSVLLRSARSDDGNTVLETMLLSPALLGGENVEELAHKIQLEEAKKIS